MEVQRTIRPSGWERTFQNVLEVCKIYMDGPGWQGITISQVG